MTNPHRTAFVCLLFCAATLTAAPLRAEGVEGVWKTCYEAEHDEVGEIDSGYLVLGPDGRYMSLEQSCCEVPPLWQSGSYRVEGNRVTLDRRRADGEPYVHALTLRHGTAVFFDDLDGPPRKVAALTAGDDLNYAWCRVYPEESRAGFD